MVGAFAAGLRLLLELVVIGGFIAFGVFFGLWWVSILLGVITAAIVAVVIIRTRWSEDV